MAGNPRATRTRNALVGAFNHLFLNRRGKSIRVPDLIAEAGIGRSTFYEHFSGVEAVRIEALAKPFAVLADAAAGQGDEQALVRLLAHFWDNRHRARSHFCGRRGEQAQRLLAQMVESRLDDPQALEIPATLAAQQLAAAAFIPIRGWLLGEASSNPASLAHSLCAAGRSLAAALRQPSAR